MIERTEKDDVSRSYIVGEGEPLGLLRGVFLPVATFGLSLYMVRRKVPSGNQK